jgi:hydroxymethylbilane synthase
MSNLIRIGVPSTETALAQANEIASLISPSNYTTELVHTNNTYAQLLEGEIDITMYAAQDLPAVLHESLEIIAFTKRERANDVLISRKRINLTTTGIRIGTSSARDAAFLKHLYPGAEAIHFQPDHRANIKKMETGECDALLMSYAEAARLGYTNYIAEKIETSYFVPAVGQGSIAVVCHKKLSFDRKEIIQRWVNHEETAECIRTERSFLKAFQGSSDKPTFGYARIDSGLITLKAGVISPDGEKVIKVKRSSALTESKELGKRVAVEVMQQEQLLPLSLVTS